MAILGEGVMEEVGSGQASLASSWLPRGARLLEIGCSTGYLTRRFAAGQAEAYGIDLNARALARARARNPAIPVACGEAERLPFKDGAFDAVVMLEVIEHTGCDAAALREVGRVLRRGGALVLSTPHAGLFAWLDPHNMRKSLERRLPRLCRAAARLVRFPSGQLTENLDVHRHYQLEEIARLLGPDFAIRRVHRGGLLLYPLAACALSVAGRLLGESALLLWLHRLLLWDFRIGFGRLSYNLVVLAEKTGRRALAAAG